MYVNVTPIVDADSQVSVSLLHTYIIVSHSPIIIIKFKPKQVFLLMVVEVF